jgi:hypothetical protein
MVRSSKDLPELEQPRLSRDCTTDFVHGTGVTATNVASAIFANAIWSGGAVVSYSGSLTPSDARLKNIIGHSASAQDARIAALEAENSRLKAEGARLTALEVQNAKLAAEMEVLEQSGALSHRKSGGDAGVQTVPTRLNSLVRDTLECSR